MEMVKQTTLPGFMMDLFNVMRVMIRWDAGEQAEMVGPFGALLRFVLFLIYGCKLLLWRQPRSSADTYLFPLEVHIKFH